MAPDTVAVEDLRPDPAELAIAVREVSRLARCGPSPRWRGAVAEAIETARDLIVPRGRRVAVDPTAVAALFPVPSAVEEIIGAGRAWAFVATIGPALEERVRRQMADGDYLGGVLLDAAGSTAVEAVCDLLQGACPVGAGEDTERFSPGYCAWTLEAQAGLFALLRPEELGVTLLPSRLMQPLKSTSGVIVRAPPEVLLMPPWACAECDARGCTRRRAAAPMRGTGRG